MTDVDEFTVKLLAGSPPNETSETPVNPVPEIVTAVPPAVVPDVVPRLVTVGADPLEDATTTSVMLLLLY